MHSEEVETITAQRFKALQWPVKDRGATLHPYVYNLVNNYTKHLIQCPHYLSSTHINYLLQSPGGN